MLNIIQNINPLYQMPQPLQDQTATTSDHMLNIMQNINPLYQMLQPLQDQTATSTDKC
jgi:hypothetical protein